MKEGFYCYRNNIYYGSYNEKQVSGRLKISTSKPECIQTEHPISEDDWTVRLWDNHSLLDPEYVDLQTMLAKMESFVNVNTEQAVMYSDEKLLAWIRSNGFYGDIHIGAVDEVHIEAFGEHLGQISWK